MKAHLYRKSMMFSRNTSTVAKDAKKERVTYAPNVRTQSKYSHFNLRRLTVVHIVENYIIESV